MPMPLRPTRTACILIALLAMAASAPAAAQPAKGPLSRDWKKLLSQNVTVVGNAQESDLRRTAVEIERFRQALGTVFPGLRMDSPRPTVAVVFRDNSAFTPFKPRDHRGRPLDNVAGYFAVHPDVNYIVLAPHDDPEFAFRVIFHEYTHFLVTRNHRSLPLWLNEGLAEFYSTFSGSLRDGRKILGRPIDPHVVALSLRTHIPLEKLTDPRAAGELLANEQSVHLFYAQSWALTHYLLVGEGGAMRPRLAAFLGQVARGAPAGASFREIFGPDLGPLGRSLRQYIGQFRLPAIQLPAQDMELQAAAEPILEIEAERLQGDLLVRLGDFALADRHLARAEALDAQHIPTRLTRARQLLAERKASDALAVLSTPAVESAASFEAEFLRAEALRASKDYGPAVDAYRRAVHLQPEAPHAYYGMSIAQTALGLKAAAASFTQCLLLQPGAVWYRLRLYENLHLGLDTYAVSDAVNYVRQSGWQDDSSTYVMLAAALTLERQGQKEEVGRVLDDVEAHIKPDSWQAVLVSFLQRQFDATALVSQARGNDELTEAHGYAGILLHIDGRTAEALEHLQWVRDHGRKDFVEYGLAMAELERIERSGSNP